MLTIDNAKLAIGEQFTESTTPAEKYAILRAFEEAIKDLYEEVTEPSIRQIMATKEYKEAAKVGGKTIPLCGGFFSIKEQHVYDYSGSKKYCNRKESIKKKTAELRKLNAKLKIIGKNLIQAKGLTPIATKITVAFAFEKPKEEVSEE